MLAGNRCELCHEVIQSTKARHPQTKYCKSCAKQKKKENTENSWSPEKIKEYMRRYMRRYRQLHPKRNRIYLRKHRQKTRKITAASDQNASFLCLALIPLLFLEPFSTESMTLWFDSLKTSITYLELIVINLTGLIVVVKVCLRHIRSPIVKKDKLVESDNSADESVKYN